MPKSIILISPISTETDKKYVYLIVRHSTDETNDINGIFEATLDGEIARKLLSDYKNKYPDYDLSILCMNLTGGKSL